ncbi:MAG: hypothetical protein IPM24_14340 [Bryobacterales bacterium]|nr:hypothetical protein [Bryobacterales bacterium]
MFNRMLLPLLVLALVSLPAQANLASRITVDLPYPVEIQGTLLEPGEYVLRTMTGPGANRDIVQIFGDRGMRLAATARSIPLLQRGGADSSKVVLSQAGDRYLLSQLVVQGRVYGYQFLPEPGTASRMVELAEQ